MDSLATVGNAGTNAAPFVVEIVEKLPEIAPIIIRNAEGTVQAGKTALNLLKGAGVAVGTGVLLGTGTALFLGGFMGVFWGVGKAKIAIENKMEARRERKAKEEFEAKKSAAMGAAVPAPA